MQVYGFRAVRALIIVFGLMPLLSCGEPTGAGAQGQGQHHGPMEVPVSPPVVRSIVEWDEYTGRFEAIRTVEVRARVSGYLTEINFKDGDIVQTGDLLFLIDPRPYAATLEQAEAQLEAAKARQSLAALDLSRGQRLVKNQTISQETFDERLQGKREADAAVAAAEAEVRTAALDREFAEVRAPINGRVSNNFVSVGNLISGGSTNATLLTTIVSLDPIHFVFDVSESAYLKYQRLDALGVRPSSRTAENTVFIKLNDETSFAHEGKMNFVDNRIDPNTGTLRGRAILANENGLFIPGLFARLRLAGSARYDAIMMPDEYISSDQSKKFVYVVDAENKVTYRPVVLGPLVDGLRVIRSGLSPEDLVVVGSLQRIRPAMVVAPKETTFLPPS